MAVWFLAFVVALLGLVLCAVVWHLMRTVDALKQGHQAIEDRTLRLLSLLGPGVAAASDNPTAILAWQPVAAVARALFPSELATLDRAAGASFPFAPARVQDAHAKWTADWLSWEQGHDATFKLKVAEAQAELAATGSALARAKLDAVEREKLDLYQAHYGQYIRVARALQALMPGQ